MTNLASFMTEDHRACDQRFAEVEGLVEAGDWAAASAAWTKFDHDTRRHFAREEQLMFPAFEQATGNTSGPTAVMRMEHDQMRALFDQLGSAIGAQDSKRFLSLSDTLMVLAQQHNMKEEQILYPMSEQVVPNAEELLAQMVALELDQG